MNKHKRATLFLLIIVIGFSVLVLISFFPSVRHRFIFRYFSVQSQEFPIPSPSELILFFPEFPFFWEKLSHHSIGVSGYENLYSYLYEVELGIRKKFGIRLTPVRWSFWLGDSCVFCFYEGEHWAMITKPHFYARFLIPIFLQRRLAREENTDFYIINIDDYVIFTNDILFTKTDSSKQLHYLDFPMKLGEDCTIYATVGNKSMELHIALQDEDKVTINGSVWGDSKANKANTRLAFSGAMVKVSGECIEWMDKVIFRYIRGLVNSKTLEQFEFPAKLYFRTIEGSPLGSLFLKLGNLVEDRNGILALMGIMEKYSVPIPILAGWFPEEEQEVSSLLQLLDLPEYTPVYHSKWDILDGYVIPLWDRAYQLCLARYNDGILFCSNESVMNEVVSALSNAPVSSSAVVVDIAALSKEYGKLYRWAVALDTKFFLNLKDFSELYPPWERFFQTLGKMELNITPEVLGNRVLIRGRIGR